MINSGTFKEQTREVTIAKVKLLAALSLYEDLLFVSNVWEAIRFLLFSSHAFAALSAA